MTEEQINLVKKTWKIFRAIEPRVVGDTFYSKLFNDHPSLRRMFPKDMDHQYKKLMDMLSIIVSRLDRLAELTEDITAMARRHAHYGVRAGHYKLVGNALLWTLEQGLGNDWSPEVKEAWQSCYSLIADAMIGASSESALK